MTLSLIYVTLLTMISQRIAEIRQNIEKVCHETGKDAGRIIVVAVTKYTTPENVEEAVKAGISDIGENRVQDARNKFSVLEHKGLEFKRHMLGHLQTNKVKDAVRLFDMIQSVDAVKVAGEIDKQAEKYGKVMDILVQVNSSHEAQKSGVRPEETLELIESVSVFKNIRVLGLMTIGLLTDDREKIMECFRLTKSLFDQARQRFSGYERVDMKYLSMGMTQDYEIALRCGANMIRIGSAIFG